MKTTEEFKKTIQTYLESRAESDALFAKSYSKTEKNIDDCITYILNTVQKSECSGFADEEVYSMAVHYYDEANIEIGKQISAKVVVNHTVEITDEDRSEARTKAIEKLTNEAYEAMKAKPTKAKVKKVDTLQPSLF